MIDAGPINRDRYVVTWKCTSNCIITTPFEAQDRLDLYPAEGRALFRRHSCGDLCDGNIETSLVLDDAGCMVMAADLQGQLAMVSACKTVTGISGELVYDAHAGRAIRSMTGSFGR